MGTIIAINKKNLEINKANRNNEKPCVTLLDENLNFISTTHSADLIIDGKLIAMVSTDCRESTINDRGGLHAWVTVHGCVEVTGK
jgi:hypothetical protein